ncbi:hypothetical protein C8Q80DRAFT_1166542 [Daedaleopsis nitida]|nr:hypothetical protein C8Q80DRAFT_1166542 [Daedaleopsis nitida]
MEMSLSTKGIPPSVTVLFQVLPVLLPECCCAFVDGKSPQYFGNTCGASVSRLGRKRECKISRGSSSTCDGDLNAGMTATGCGSDNPTM